MKKEENHIDQHFRNGLRDYESPLAANLWDKLDAAREGDKKPKGIIWWKWGVGALLLTSLIALTVYFISIQKATPNQPDTRTDINAPITSASVHDPVSPAIDMDAATNEVSNSTIISSDVLNVPTKEKQKSTVSQRSAENIINQPAAVVNPNFNQNTALNLDTENPVWSATTTETNVTDNNISRDLLKTNTAISTAKNQSADAPEIQITENTETDSPEENKAARQLNYLTASTTTALKNAPDLQTVFAAPPIKIPFSWGPKGCYSFAGGRIKYDYFVDGFISPEYTIRNLTAKDPEDDPYRQLREDTESTLHGVSGGVRLSIVTRRGLALRTGIVYSRILERFNLEKEGDERIVQIVPAGTTDTITTIETGTTFIRNHNRYRSLDIPLLIGYEIDAGKFNFSINAGAYFNILARQKGKILSQSDTLEFITSNNPQRINAFEKDLGISVYGSLGLGYHIRPNLQLLIEPNFRYQLKSITLESYPLDQQYVNIGLLLGVRRQF